MTIRRLDTNKKGFIDLFKRYNNMSLFKKGELKRV